MRRLFLRLCTGMLFWGEYASRLFLGVMEIGCHLCYNGWTKKYYANEFKGYFEIVSMTGLLRSHFYEE